jgi:hypothetical protein
LIIAHRRMVTALKHRYNSRFLPCGGEMLLSKAQIKCVPKNRYKDSRIAFYDKLRSVIKPNRFRRF